MAEKHPTEKSILRNYLASQKDLNTRVTRFKPAKVKNLVPQHDIGRYRPFNSRMCATAEMKIINKYLAKNQKPPSFLEAGPRRQLYFEPHTVRIGIVTPGGIAPGLNTVIHSIVDMHGNIYRMRKKAYGFRYGFEGLAEGRSMKLDADDTIEWIHKGGTFLGADRREQNIPAMVETLEHKRVNILYVIGGDGSLTVAHEIAQEIKKRGKRIVVAGIPKTMDNDILWVWHSFGFDTAVEEATRLVNSLHDEARSTRRVCLIPLFGRDAGFVAAHAALASGQVDVVLVPEVAFRIEPLLEHIEETVADKEYAVIVLAEGACPKGYKEDDVRAELRREGRDPDNRTDPGVAAALRNWRLHALQRELEKHFQEFKKGEHGVFVTEPRYIIRAIPAGSIDQIYCRRLADLAVHNTLAGFTDFMISQWLSEYVLVPLRLVAGKHKTIPPGGIFWTTVIASTGQPSFD